MAKSTDNLDAYDLYFRALHEYYKTTQPSLDAAMALLRRALAADPNWALAKGFPARIYTVSDSLGWVDAADKGIPVALAREVIASGSDDPAALRGAGHAMSHFGQDYPAALATLDRTLRLQPNSAQVFEALGWVHCHAADPAPAVGYFQRALRLSPLDLEIGVTLSGLGAALLMLGQTEEAYAPLRRAAEELPTCSGGHRWLILACVRLGRLDEARAVATRMMQYIPGIRVPTASQFSNRVLVEEYRQAQRLAGIPD
jgi:adenylate cyclase